MNTVDLAVSASWIVPVIPENRVYENCSLIVNNGLILDILPNDLVESRYQAKEHIQLLGQVLTPGLINAHGHSAMSLLRGYADDYPLMTWLEEHIWPAEQQFVNEAFVRDGTELAIAEMLLSGTTCFSDMYFFPEVSAEVAKSHGMRAQINFPILDFPTAWGSGPDEYFRKGLDLWDQYRTQDLVNIGFGPHAPYTVSDDALSKVATYAEELQAPVQIHLHETAFEVQQALENKGQRPIERLKALGLLSPLLQCVHMTQIADTDLELLHESGAHVVHCPDSNLKLASGVCPVQTLLNKDINVALGTDGAASNNDLNLFNEIQSAALIAKHQQNDASALPAHKALELGTINGARALGMGDKIGSLEKGKMADFIAIDLNDFAFQPVYNPISQLVYTQVGQNVSHVWIQGKQLVKNRELTSINKDKLLKTVNSWQEKLKK